MYLNIITPCSRPHNLFAISRSITIPRDSYRWIVVLDEKEMPWIALPDNCEPYAYYDSRSKVGNAQRNLAMKLVVKGHLYFNDDDTTVHPDLWSNVKDLTEDFISFGQADKSGAIRLVPTLAPKWGNVDSHNFIVSHEASKDSRWLLDKYEADAYFAEACFRNSKTFKEVDKVLSTYNSLR